MWVSKKKLKADYELELMKQTDPYSYYINQSIENSISKPENEGEHGNVPFICMNGEKIEENTHRMYDAGDYLLYESKTGVSSDEERAELITEAEKINADLIYSDVDHITCDGKRHDPFFKPDFGIDTHRCYDYISDFYAVKKNKSKCDLSLLENIAHVTKPLFHINDNNNASDSSYGSLINNKCYRTDEFYINETSISNEKNEISVIIPSKDNPHLLDKCLDGIEKAKIKSGINKIEVVIVDNGSRDIHKEEITRVIEKHKSQGNYDIYYIYEPFQFNFSRMCNIGVERAATGSYLLFMNDDIEITDELFLLKLLYFARMDHVGAVGCKLLYPGEEKRIQHVGITCLKYPGPSHKLATFKDDKSYYFGRNLGIHNVLAVTGAMLMVSKEKYFKIGGFHDKMKVGYNDVDLCVSLYENGYLNVVNNDCVLVHHESITRGSDSVSEEKLSRLDSEREMLYERHPWILKKGDPFYNPNLAGDFLDYRVNVIPDFERRDYESECDYSLLDSLNRHNGNYKNLFFNIEGVVTSRNHVEVSGWALLNKKDNYLYDTYLIAYTGDDFSSEISLSKAFCVAKVNREDLTTVFPDAKTTSLSGFFARIKTNDIESVFTKDEIDVIKNLSDSDGEKICKKDYLDRLIEKIKFGIVIKNKQTGKKYYAGKR